MEEGRKQMPKIYGMAGRNLGASGFRLFWSVLLPASLPFIVNGMKQGWAFAWRSLIQAEMIFLSLGLGQLLMMGRDLSDMSQVMAVNDSDRHPRLHGGWPDLPHHGAASARELWADASVGEQVLGLRSQENQSHQQ